MEDKVYRFWLHNLPGVGDRTAERLLAHFGGAKEVCCAGTGDLKQFLREKTIREIMEFNKTFDPQKVYDKMSSDGIAFFTGEDEAYPDRLRQLKSPPYGIYCLGKLPEKERPAVAVIGARECSEYGRIMAEAFAGGLARAGISIISGMARGIDGLAQQAALIQGGRTYAVLGCGVDVCYPASNRDLYQKILESGGGILSVFPPGLKPARRQFPERNRIVAGLSDLVLVVEARLKSGTCITVDMALEQGKNVYAVPGRLTDRLSDGCNLLLRQGAGIALSPEDLLAEILLLRNRNGQGGAGREKLSKAQKETQAAAGREKQSRVHGKTQSAAGKREAAAMEKESPESGEDSEVLQFLDYYPRSSDEILEAMQRAGIKRELPFLLRELVLLCMDGRARQTGGNCFFRTGGRT